MLIFNVDSPLLKQELEQENILEKKAMIEYFSKMLKFGIAFLIIGILIISIYGFPPQKQHDPYRIYLMLFLFWNTITTILLMLPLMVKGYIIQALDSQYRQASLEKLHNCNAYLNMLGMEKHKNYAENVRQQGRELTNFECDEIIKYWNSKIHNS